MEVKVVDNQLEHALRILKRRFYEKPSVKKKRKQAEALKRRLKVVRKPFEI